MRPVILASQSPRRQDLLARMGVTFTTVVSGFAEAVDSSRSPQVVAVELAVGKAATVARQHPEAVVIGSDTVVAFQGHQMERPRDEEQARQWLRSFAGDVAEVVTGVAVICQSAGLHLTGEGTSRVYFGPYDEVALEAYLATGDPLDKAGAFGVQSGAAPLIDHLEGDVDSIIGLPTRVLAPLLQQAGLEAHPADVSAAYHQIAELLSE
jgi:septum formation protein